MGIFALNCPDFTICHIHQVYMHSSIETAPLCNILEQSDHYSWRHCILKICRDTSVVSECSLSVNLVIDNICMYLQILHLCIKFESNQTITYGDIAFWRFGRCECRLAANAVVLVLGGYQISIATYLRGGIYPHLKEIGWIFFGIRCMTLVCYFQPFQLGQTGAIPCQKLINSSVLGSCIWSLFVPIVLFEHSQYHSTGGRILYFYRYLIKFKNTLFLYKIYQQGTNVAHNVRGGLPIDLTIVAIALLLRYTLSMSLKLTDITQWNVGAVVLEQF